MSFLKTLTTLAVGFAAAKGYDKFRKSGGMSGMTDALKNAGSAGGFADQAAAMAEKMGIPGGAEKVREMIAKMGPQAASMAEQGQAGLDSLMGTVMAATAKGSATMSEMFDKMTAGTPMGVASEENAKLMIRAMIMAAKADGTIDAEERQAIMDKLGDASEEELAFVQAELDAPVDVSALAAAAGDSMKTQIYAAAAMAMKNDTPAEQQFLDQLAAALGLDAAARAAIHGSIQA
jgi:uncharacterized membrane protein YebE (DUF533 family)